MEEVVFVWNIQAAACCCEGFPTTKCICLVALSWAACTGQATGARTLRRMSVEMILPMPISQLDTMRGTGFTRISTSCTTQGLPAHQQQMLASLHPREDTLTTAPASHRAGYSAWPPVSVARGSVLLTESMPGHILRDALWRTCWPDHMKSHSMRISSGELLSSCLYSLMPLICAHTGPHPALNVAHGPPHPCCCRVLFKTAL